MSLFDETPRMESEPRRYAQSAFRYLDQVARPEATRVRDILDLWFDDFPLDGQNDFLARFRSPQTDQHAGAFFELYCHALLKKHGFDVATHQRADVDKPTLPDFLACRQGAPTLYLESTLATDDRGSQGSAQRLAQVYDALNQIDTPDFFLHIDLHSSPSEPPSVSRLCSFVRKKLAGLDPDKMRSLMEEEGLDALPHWESEDRGLHITVTPIPKSPEQRGRPGVRPIGSTSQGFSWVDCRSSIVNSLRGKAGKYGTPNLPYIIAVDATAESVDDKDIPDALIGSLQWSSSQGVCRSPNGLWVSPAGPTYRRVSAVLSVVRLDSWNIARCTPVLWHNPWADHPLDPEVWRIPQMIPNHASCTYQKREGLEGWELFGLWPTWPEANPQQ